MHHLLRKTDRASAEPVDSSPHPHPRPYPRVPAHVSSGPKPLLHARRHSNPSKTESCIAVADALRTRCAPRSGTQGLGHTNNV